MSQLLRDPTAFQQVNPATGIVLDFDMGSDGRVTTSPSHILKDPEATFEGRAQGLFPRNPDAVSTIRGTIQVEGSYSQIVQAQTIVYLTPGLTPHNDCLEVGVTLIGRPNVRIWDKDGVLVLSVTGGKQLSKSFWLRFVWDSTTRPVYDRFAQLYSEDQVDAGATWSVTPTRPWVPLEANYIGIRNGYGLPGGTWPMNGTLRKVLIEKTVNTKF